jgi:hypothetical protein
MYLDFEPDDVFDRLAFKEFTKSGTKVDYLVWPALYLYKDGPLLSKGVVLATGEKIYIYIKYHSLLFITI